MAKAELTISTGQPLLLGSLTRKSTERPLLTYIYSAIATHPHISIHPFPEIQ